MLRLTVFSRLPRSSRTLRNFALRNNGLPLRSRPPREGRTWIETFSAHCAVIDRK